MSSSLPAGRPPRWRRWALAVAIVAGALLLQRQHLVEVPTAVGLLRDAHAGWVVAGLLAAAVTYPMAAWAMIGTVHEHVPFATAVRVQVATALTTLAAPAGLGSAGINVWFLQRHGVARAEAVAAALRNGIAGGAVHVAGLAVVVWQLPQMVTVDPAQVTAAARLLGGVTGVGVVLLLAAAWRWPARRRQATALLAGLGRTTGTLLRRADRVVPLAGGSVGLTLANGCCLWASARAVGIPLDLPTALALELVVEALGGLAATPGGVGVVEAATLQGLLLVGAAPAGALAVVLLHRLLTFWLPALPGAVALRSLRAAPPSRLAVSDRPPTAAPGDLDVAAAA